MGKFYTFIHKGTTNSKVRTDRLQEYLSDGWEIGNWNQQELNRRSGDGVLRFYNGIRSNGTYDAYRESRSRNVSNGLKAFWQGADDSFRAERENRKRASREKWSPEFKEIVHTTMSNSAKKNRATISPEEYRNRSVKATITKKKNGTFGVSSFEDTCYNALCAFYGESNIAREYDSDIRYAHRCDFYVKPLDLFIELNIHPSHGDRPFDPMSQEDNAEYLRLRSSSDPWDNMVASVWGERDRVKVEDAVSSGINYLVVYKDSFDILIKNIAEGKLCDSVK